MNANNKNSQMKHFPCPKYGMIYRPNMYNLQVRKKHPKNSITKIYNLLIRLEQFTDQKKKAKKMPISWN